MLATPGFCLVKPEVFTLWFSQLLGKAWAGHTAAHATGSKQFWQDVLAAGPLLGMTFAIAAVRDIPVQEAATCVGLCMGRMACMGSWAILRGLHGCVDNSAWAAWAFGQLLNAWKLSTCMLCCTCKVRAAANHGCLLPNLSCATQE